MDGVVGSNVSISEYQIWPGRVGGTTKSSGSHHPLTMRQKSSSTSGLPSAARSGSSRPSRYKTRHRALGSSQSPWVIGVPDGVNQPS